MSGNSHSGLRWTLAGIAIGLVFLWLALRNADVDASLQALSQLRTHWLLPIVGCALLFMLVKSWRWHVLLRPVMTHDERNPIGHFGLLHRAVYAGTAANLVVAHTGEVLRATLIARRTGVAASAVLASIALERVLDFAALLVLIGLAFLIDPKVSTVLWSAALISLVLMVIGLTILMTLLSPGPRADTLGKALSRVLPTRIADWVSTQLSKGRAGLGAMREPATLMKVLLLSLLQWLWIVLSIAACAMAIGVQIPLSGAITVFVLTVIGLTLPSSPAQLGTVQLAFVAGLTLMDAPAASALAASLVYTCLVNGTMMLIGAVCWLRWPHARLIGSGSGAAGTVQAKRST